MNFSYLYHSPGIAKQGDDMASHSNLISANNPIVDILQNHRSVDNAECGDIPANGDELNLPDDQSLISALENVSIDRNIVRERAMHSSVKYNYASHVPHLWLDGQYHPTVNKCSLFDSADASVIQIPNLVDGSNMADQTLLPTNEINKFNFQINCHVDKGAKLKAHELKRQKPESLSGSVRDLWYRGSMYTGDMSFVPGMNFQFVSSVSFPGAEFQPSAFQQQYCLEKHPTYMQPWDLSHSCVAWEDQYLMMHQKHLHLQQLHNQEVHQLQNGCNSIVRSLSGAAVPACFDVCNSHQVEQPNSGHYCARSSLEQVENQQDLAFTANGPCRYYAQGFCGEGDNFTYACAKKQATGSALRHSRKNIKWVQALKNVGKQNFPEKILTRSNGSKLLRIPKSGPLKSNELVNHPGFKGKVVPNSQFHLSIQIPASFKVDNGKSEDLSSDNSDYRLTSKSPLQKYESLDEVGGRIYLLSKDQQGCRFLQEDLMKGTCQDVHKIFIEVIGHILELMTDPFGNYLVQKLLEVCNEEQKMHIIREMTSKAGETIRISCDTCGTRVIQKVIETLNTKEQISMVISSLKPSIVPLIKDTNGNHVVQHCLQHLSPEFTKSLFDDAIVHCVDLAKDRGGCCVLQGCLSCLDGRQRERLMADISSNALVLSQHPFGNYVVQFLLELNVPSAMEGVLDQLEGNFGYLSVQKFSSNVVEKCLECATEARHVRIVGELMNDPQLVQILKDRYGNYVIQSAIKSCKGALYAAFVEAIRPHIPEIQRNRYGKKVLSSLSRKK